MRVVFVIAIAIVGYLFLKNEIFGGEFGIPELIVTVLLALPLFALGLEGKKKDETVDQQRRDAVLQKRIDETAKRVSTPSREPAAADGAAAEARKPAPSHEDLPVSDILFLRPFVIDTAVRVRNPRLDGWASFLVPFYSFMLPRTVSLDDAIRLHLRKYGELVAIGAPGSIVGASRVRVGDAYWQNYFGILAAKAKMIVVFCGLRPGTMWELEQIARDHDLLRKTVFILPPDWVGGEHEATNLGQVLQTLRTLDLSPPADTKGGEALVFKPDRTVRSRSNIFVSDLTSYRVSKKALQMSTTSALAR
jgi:hypothetical protein